MFFYNPPGPDDKPEGINLPNISDDGLKVLSESWPKNIKELRLVGDKINNELFDFILNNLPKSVENLILCNNNIDGIFYEKLPENIRVLCIAGNHIAADGFKRVIKKLPKDLDVLSFELNLIDGKNERFEDLDLFPKKLSRLFLSDNTIGINGFKNILKKLPNSLEILRLNRNDINNLMNSTNNLKLDIRNPQKLPDSLKELHLSGNDMSKEDIAILISSLIFPENFNKLVIDNHIFNYGDILGCQLDMALAFKD